MSESDRSIYISPEDEDYVYFDIKPRSKRPVDYDPRIDCDDVVYMYDLLRIGEGDMNRGAEIVFTALEEGKMARKGYEEVLDSAIDVEEHVLIANLVGKSLNEGRLDSFEKGHVTDLMVEMEEFDHPAFRLDVPGEEGDFDTEFEGSAFEIFPYEEPDGFH